MKTGWMLAAGLVALLGLLSCGNDEGNTIESSTGGVSSGTGGTLVVGAAPEGAQTIEGMDDCTGCTDEEGCLSVFVSRAEDDSQQPWVVSPEDADGVGTLYAAVTQLGELTRQQLDEIDLQSGAGPFHVAMCVGVGSGTLSVFLDDNDNATEADSSSTDGADSCADQRAVTVQITNGKTFSLPYELTGSCD